MGNDKAVTIEKAVKCADHVLRKMKLDDHMSWSEWWETFIVPNDSDPYLDFDCHRHSIKNLINKEFRARGIGNIIFVDHSQGVFMLDEKTAVGSKFLLGRIKKQASITKTSIKNCYELSQANGLTLDESRMLKNAATHIDGNFTLLAGAIGRMKSLPKNVKRIALSYLGVDL